MQDGKSRVLIVSGRSLVAHGLQSLLAGRPEISQVEIIGSLYDALIYSLTDPPDAMVIDMPPGADLFVDRPVSVNGHEIKTIVLVEGDKDVEARLYVHIPGRTANLDNLMAAILWDGQGAGAAKPPAKRRKQAKTPVEPADLLPHLSQPSNFIRAKASGPSKFRISSSNDVE
ncbi:MAG: hypothetical protein ACJ78Q_03530 [Chloroflexia bacterium]